MGGGSREADGVEEGAAADSENVGVAADLVGLDRGEGGLDDGGVLLGGLTAGEHERLPSEVHSHGLTVGGDLGGEARTGGRQTGIDDRDDLGASEEVGEHTVTRSERAFGEEDAMAVGYREFEVKGVVHSPGEGLSEEVRRLRTSQVPNLPHRKRPKLAPFR